MKIDKQQKLMKNVGVSMDQAGDLVRINECLTCKWRTQFEVCSNPKCQRKRVSY